MKLNLTATTNVNKVILNYLENNVTEELANKINNGVEIDKNGLKLINKKTLDGFMNYATNEARKLAEKSARSAVVQDDIVYGWAIHYFEEDSIEETLYNLDGTKYEEPKPVKQQEPTQVQTTTQVKVKSKQEQAGQLSFFDILDNTQNEEPKQETVTEEIQTVETEVVATPEKKISPLYEKYFKLKEKYQNYIVLIRLGDFYEAFGDDATQIANKINLTLTGRDFGLEKRVPMVGFPYHVSDVYFNNLTKYFTLVIEENNDIVIKEKITEKQTEQPKTIFETYKEIKDAYPDFVIALKVKNYYEIYGNIAQELANEFGYLLTRKDNIYCIRCYEMLKNNWVNKISQTHNIAFGSKTDDLEFYTRKQ